MQEKEGVPVKVTVRDRRRVTHGAENNDKQEPREQQAPEASAPQADDAAREPNGTEQTSGREDYLEDLRRVQAEFENYKKRMIREQTAIAERASGRLIENLLTVLDNFERAIEHGEGGEGVALVYKDFKKTLAEEGLEEVPAEGVPFDPNVHEAVESHEDERVTTPTADGVYRRGYTLKGKLLRAAMVTVARPVEAPVEQLDDTDAEPLESAEGG